MSERAVELPGNRINAVRTVATGAEDLLLALVDLESVARMLVRKRACISCDHDDCAAVRLADRGLSYLDRSRR